MFLPVTNVLAFISYSAVVTPQVLNYEQQITALSKVCNVNKAYALEHVNVVFSLVTTAHLQP
jgi:hypothetical protein